MGEGFRPSLHRLFATDFYFFWTASDVFLLRRYTAAAKITVMAKTTPGVVQLTPAPGGALVVLVAGAIVVAAVVALDTG